MDIIYIYILEKGGAFREVVSFRACVRDQGYGVDLPQMRALLSSALLLLRFALFSSFFFALVFYLYVLFGGGGLIWR